MADGDAEGEARVSIGGRAGHSGRSRRRDWDWTRRQGKENAMIIIEVMGGLGNQMQQYALYQKMKSLGKEAKLDVSWFRDEKRQEGVLARRKLELEYFTDLPMEICTPQEKKRLIGGDDLLGKLKRKLLPGQNRHFYESGMYHPEIFDFDDMYLSGYWACEKYYSDILPELRKLIKFPEIKNSLNSEIIRRMKSEMSVSIHIRRGDYLDPENAAMFGGICTEEYYASAIKYVLERCPEAHFYIFSDDSAYVKEKYCGPQYTIVDWNTGENSFYDILLMSSCRHNICANSTFSFWGARLNDSPDKIMIRPAKHKNSQQIIPETMHELWENWVLIEGNGRIV